VRPSGTNQPPSGPIETRLPEPGCPLLVRLSSRFDGRTRASAEWPTYTTSRSPSGLPLRARSEVSRLSKNPAYVIPSPAAGSFARGHCRASPPTPAHRYPLPSAANLMNWTSRKRPPAHGPRNGPRGSASVPLCPSETLVPVSTSPSTTRERSWNSSGDRPEDSLFPTSGAPVDELGMRLPPLTESPGFRGSTSQNGGSPHENPAFAWSPSDPRRDSRRAAPSNGRVQMRTTRPPMTSAAKPTAYCGRAHTSHDFFAAAPHARLGPSERGRPINSGPSRDGDV